LPNLNTVDTVVVEVEVGLGPNTAHTHTQ